VRIAIMVCLEDVVPSFGRELAALDPDLIVNVTNDTWFDLDAEPHQHEALARYRTIEVGAPMIRAVNTGPSSVIDRDGARPRPARPSATVAPSTLLARGRARRRGPSSLYATDRRPAHLGRGLGAIWRGGSCPAWSRACAASRRSA
jgi:predicted amidohydrolase